MKLPHLLAAAVMLACSPTAAPAQSATDPAALVVDDRPLPVVIAGRNYDLDALILRRPGTDRLPVALITHGASPLDPRLAQIDWLRSWADELAQRGWLAVAVMRRGYGKSEGEIPGDGGGCGSPNVGRYLDAEADDLEAALKAVAQRPDADLTRVLGIGHSAGGAVMMALAARARPPLAAVINVAGGLAPRQLGPFRTDPACDAYTSDMVWNFARFGTTARMPTLWLYAENDSWFRPGLVSRMRSAFEGSGGRSELVMLPPFGADGHTLFFANGGRDLLLPEVDRFLREHGLPTWDAGALAPLLRTLSAKDRHGVEFYLRSLPTEKALALGPSGGVYWRTGKGSLDDARTGVLAYCRQQSGGECRLAVEDFDPLPAIRGTGSTP